MFVRCIVILLCLLVSAMPCLAAEQDARVSQLFKEIKQLQASRPFKKDAIEKITGQKLKLESAGTYLSNPVSDGMINHLECPFDFDLRIGAIMVVLNAKPMISVEMVSKVFGKTKLVKRHPDLHAPDNKKPITYVYGLKGKVMEFEFEQNHHLTYLRGVHFD